MSFVATILVVILLQGHMTTGNDDVNSAEVVIQQMSRRVDQLEARLGSYENELRKSAVVSFLVLDTGTVCVSKNIFLSLAIRLMLVLPPAPPPPPSTRVVCEERRRFFQTITLIYQRFSAAFARARSEYSSVCSACCLPLLPFCFHLLISLNDSSDSLALI